MTDSVMAAINGNVLHIPTVLGAVVPTFNWAGLSQPVRFTPAALVDIFFGRITSWDDARIASANPSVSLPQAHIVVVHRSDGSGTNLPAGQAQNRAGNFITPRLDSSTVTPGASSARATIRWTS